MLFWEGRKRREHGKTLGARRELESSELLKILEKNKNKIQNKLITY